MSGSPWLTLVIATPLLAAVIVALTPQAQAWFVKTIALLSVIVTAALVAGLLIGYPGAAASAGTISFKYVENASWIPSIGASYQLGLNGVSSWFLALNAGVFLIGAVVALSRKVHKPKVFLILLLLTQAATAGVLLSTDLLLFYVFWEGMLIPLYFLLSTYGNEKRRRATVKFVGYTVAGSLLMLISIIYLHVNSGTNSFNYSDLLGRTLTSQSAVKMPVFGWKLLTPDEFAFLAFAIAFAIKVPLVPFHTWLPDLYESCPASGLTFFAGLVSKLGIYGFIQFAMPLFPEQARAFQGILLVLALLSILYGALMALQERDIKRIVAYSSISHLGFISLGVFALTTAGLHGALLQVINHGIIIVALFLILEWVEVRAGTRDRGKIAGLEKSMPWLYFLFLITTLAALGMPGLNGFAGEFTIMLGAFEVNWLLAVIAGGGVILASWYMLRLHQGLMHEPAPEHMRDEPLADLAVHERWILAPLVVLMVVLGLFPGIVTTLDAPSVSQYAQAEGANQGTIPGVYSAEIGAHR